MRFAFRCQNSILSWGIISFLSLTTLAIEVDLPVSATTAKVESDNTAVYYSSPPLLLGNDGDASTGGFHVFSLEGTTPLNEFLSKVPGRTKLVTAIYDIAKTDYVMTIAQTDSAMRAFTVGGEEVAQKTALGDWSALCPWKSNVSGNQYMFLFGKKQVVQLAVQAEDGKPKMKEVQTFNVPIEASSCVASTSGQVFFATDDNKDVHSFNITESTATPATNIVGQAPDDIEGLAMYIGLSTEYLLVASKDAVAVYSSGFNLSGTMKISGVVDPEIKGISVHQTSSTLAYALEDADGKSFATSSLDAAFKSLSLDVNTSFNPKSVAVNATQTTCGKCNSNGFCNKSTNGTNCDCFAGFTGDSCKDVTCVDNCSGHGTCTGANECTCDSGFGGLQCSFSLVEPKLETAANGGDGDDPAVWISPTSFDQSRIITTTKSGAGAGLAVFDLQGQFLQSLSAAEPNNVDVVYGFNLGNNITTDLAYAGCRGDNTLCLFPISSHGTLSTIGGGSQPTIPDFEVYGSCSYKSQKTGTQFLFVNSKKAQYLQYSLIATSNGTLSTTLVRNFTAGSGRQTEGCVADEPNGRLILGEETEGLWSYDAEPDNLTPEGIKIAKVSTYTEFKAGDLYADVEGVTIVPGKNLSDGFIIVSNQGVSAYAVYERAPPHTFVKMFTIGNSADGKVDHVSNTDGVTVVGNRLNDQFPSGMVVVHDDANELAEGGTSAEASFKMVSLADVLSEEQLGRVDKEWNPRG
ncbi:hypothetical protein BJ875DRAFT_436990 [Amylocarpus encephaloides]|uniref:3-phytase n=1 Tax=Amylocarpus encephaloides TaxID=45428 RepID=A0A9P7YS64_9HELO|nr:hypothetical protein BJ875DRAFT_436990 [Amylocarpus encephaloides]